MGMALVLVLVVDTNPLRVKMEHLMYKGGCGVCDCMHIEMFKRRAGLGYR